MSSTRPWPGTSRAAFICLAILGLPACVVRTERPALVAPTPPPVQSKQTPYLKAHLKSGEVYLLNAWQVASDGSRLEGTGARFTVQRAAAGTGAQSIPIDEIALLETNTPERVVSLAAGVLSGLTVVMGTVTTACVLDPKSCFGSCPTFYTDEDSQGRPDAEGFSDAIARVLEARDVDALFMARPTGSTFALTMRNEAQETHAVRRVRLLAAPRPDGGRVLAGADGRYHTATRFVAPARCVAPEGDCLAAIATHDGIERRASSDGTDLASREAIELTFAPTAGRVGLVVAARQSLLSTFLFYQTMAYLGRNAGDYLAALERGGRENAERAMGMARALGGIDVSVAEGDGPWTPIGTFDEAGPIAGDVRVLPFESGGQSPLRVRLSQAKGHWRLGWVALAHLGEPVAPLPIEAASVTRDGRTDQAARASLAGRNGHLVTMPGDAYRITFNLPGRGADFELFLETEGYYYEWMRTEWLQEENPWMAALALGMPEEALRRLAGPFKERESTLEAAFWASRFRKGGPR